MSEPTTEWLRERMAQAWDEGYAWAMDDDPRALAGNPYRAIPPGKTTSDE